jgi:hypothetical protein
MMQLSALDLDMAPDAPGIYAWYSQLALSDADWKPQVRDGVDLAAGYLIKAVADYARVHQPNPVHLRGEGSYRLNWSGALRRASIADATPDIEGSGIGARLGDLAAEPQVRQLLTRLLRAATPAFASPLYIGVATNLRIRLAEHMAAYDDTRKALRQNPSAATRLQFEGTSFGERLAATGLQLEHLQCWILQANFASATGGEDPESATSARHVGETAEWILQRIFLPVLGRQ